MMKSQTAPANAKRGLQSEPLPAISQAMLTPPPPPRWGVLARPRLISRLDTALSHRLTLLTAPAGYGKTVLLGQWLALPTVQQRCDAAWLMLDDAAQDPLHLIGGLIQALADYLTTDTLQRLAELLADPQTGPRLPLTVLLNALTGRPRPLLLVLDDVQALVPSREALATLDQLLNQAPAHLRSVFSSRQTLSLAALSRLRAQGQVLDLTLADLRFTPGEVAQLFADVFDYPLSGEQANYLARRAEGWPVALSLVYQTGQQAGADRAAHLLREFGGAVPQLYDYLAVVVLDGQPPPLRRFLLTTSILDRLELDLCNALSEGENAAANAAATLAHLEKQGLFTLPLDARRSAYRYHALFREFLQRRLLEAEGVAAVRHLHRRAAALFLERDDDELAIQHLLAAQDYDDAADLIQPLQNRLLPHSRLHLLERWLGQFPPAFAETHPWLLLTQAKLAAIRGERDRARQLYHRAEPLLHARQDRAGLHDLYHDLGSAAQDQGEFALAGSLYARALEYTQDDVHRAVLLGQMARCLYMQDGRVQEALDLMSEAVDLAERSGDPLGRASLFSLQGRMRSSLGDFHGALEAWHIAQDLLESFGNRHRQVGLLNNTAYHHCLLGELDQAEAAARRALDLAQTFGRASGHAYALNVLGEVHRRRGEYTAAHTCHLEALARQRQQNEPYETAVTLNWLAVLARHAGDLDEALRWGEEGLALREKLGTDYETGLSLIDVGAAHLARGNLEEAEAMWRRALGIYVAAAARYEQVQLTFYLAVLAQRRGDGDALDRRLARSFSLARSFEHGDPVVCLHFFVEEAAWTVPLLTAALRRGLVSRCVDCLLPRLGQPAVEALLPLLDDEEGPVRARAAELLASLASAAALEPLARHRRDPDAAVRRAVTGAIETILAVPPPPLRVQCLGRFCLWRGETQVTRWGRSAARSVFQYLLAHHSRPVPMDLLMDAFWPESGPVQARKNLHQAVAALRRALEPELAAGMPSRYLRVGDNTYTLELPPGSRVDHEEFEARLRPLVENAEREPPDANLLADVLALYQGDYLAESLYEEWTTLPRERLRILYLSGLRLLARAHLQTGPSAAAAAAAAAARALELDPWDEEAGLFLMQAHEAQGNLPAALRAYEALRDRLKRDLDLPPRKDLTALYHQFRRR
jgi:LuxR family maltose regulon positive regulatory protein